MRSESRSTWQGIESHLTQDKIHGAHETQFYREGNMTLRMQNVAIRKLPETLNAKRGRLFFDELESCVNVDRPRLVLDCSNVRQMDSSALLLLLCCLEEAMKRNGDVKLAGIHEGARVVLGLTRLDRLFETYDTIADAVNSFRRVSVVPVSHASAPHDLFRPSENAA
jgi:anti-anti-sigma factor